MGSADKARKQDEEKVEGWVEPTGSEAISGTILPHDDEDDAIGELLGESTAPVAPRRFRITWTHVRWALLAAFVLAVALPLTFWAQYQSQHVTSKNAAVRGHLAEIGSRLNGIVSSVEVDVGDRVAKGDVLVKLEARHLVAEVQEARAEVAGLERSIEVERLQIELSRQEMGQEEQEAIARVNQARAQVEAARIAVEDADRAYELRHDLFERDGAVSSEALREAESGRRKAQARLDEAQANLEARISAEKGVLLTGGSLFIREQNVGVMEADLMRAEAKLARAEAELEGATIRAPEDGAILRRIIQPGGSVEGGQPIMSMWLGEEMWVEAWVEEEDIGHVRVGGKVTVTLQSFPGREFTGVVDKIGLATDLEMPDSEVPQPRGTRMKGAPVVGVRILLDDPPSELLPGLSAVVAIDKEG
jgi:ABC exporter DevB family membrane fusion protein